MRDVALAALTALILTTASARLAVGAPAPHPPLQTTAPSSMEFAPGGTAMDGSWG